MPAWRAAFEAWRSDPATAQAWQDAKPVLRFAAAVVAPALLIGVSFVLADPFAPKSPPADAVGVWSPPPLVRSVRPPEAAGTGRRESSARAAAVLPLYLDASVLLPEPPPVEPAVPPPPGVETPAGHEIPAATPDAPEPAAPVPDAVPSESRTAASAGPAADTIPSPVVPPAPPAPAAEAPEPDALRLSLLTLRDLSAEGRERARALLAEASALRRAGRLSEAEGLLREAVRIAPADPVARNNLADLLLARRAYEEARQEATTALALGPADPGPVLDTLGWALAGLGRDGEAVEILSRSVQAGRTAVRLYHRGVVHKRLGDFLRAKADLEAALVLAEGPLRDEIAAALAELSPAGGPADARGETAAAKGDTDVP